jgi:NADH dehydrogenase FAD-containing subunit
MLTFVIQVANQEGVFLADLLSGRISDPAKKSFKYVHRGELAILAPPVSPGVGSDFIHN